MKEYYIFINEEQLGPLNIDELKAKKLSRETKVWFEGLEDWKNASEIDELKKILNSIPPPINSFASKPPTPKIENKQTNSTEPEDDDETPKILGLKKNVFYGVLGGLIFLIGIIYFNNLQENNRIELMQQNQQTETHNQQLEQQQKEIEEQNNRLAEQEKIETQRIAKEKKQVIDNRLFEIRDLLDTNYQNLENAKIKLNDITSFKLLRTSSERNEQISLAQNDVDYYKSEIQKLEAEFEKINPYK
jgi:hypothetical protein